MSNLKGESQKIKINLTDQKINSNVLLIARTAFVHIKDNFKAPRGARYCDEEG